MHSQQWLVHRHLPDVEKTTFLLCDGPVSLKTIGLVDLMLLLCQKAHAEERSLLVLSGFVSDLCEGKLRRDHNDLDVVVPEADVDHWRSQLEAEGFVISAFHSKDARYAFPAERGEVHVDVGGISMEEQKIWDRTTPDVEYVWPIVPSELVWERKIGGVPVRFISPKLALAFKEEAGRNAAHDLADMALLRRYLAEKA